MEMMQLSVTVGSSFALALFQAFLHKSDHLDKKCANGQPRIDSLLATFIEEKLNWAVYEIKS